MPLPLRGLPGGSPPDGIRRLCGREDQGGAPGGAPPRACALLAGEPLLLDECPELLGHLSGSDRLVAHDRLQRLCPAAELDRVTSEVLLSRHSSPPARICARGRGPTVSSDWGATQTICAPSAVSSPAGRPDGRRPSWAPHADGGSGTAAETSTPSWCSNRRRGFWLAGPLPL